MAKIIYKQQHVGDNGRKYSAARNANYVKYIGEREHVLTNSHETNLVKYIGEREHAIKHIDKRVVEEGEKLTVCDVESDDKIEYDIGREKLAEEMAEKQNGLFGYINGHFSDTYNTAQMQKYVRKITTPHRNVFHSVFSFTPESADEAGLRTLKDWQNWTKYHISDIANCMNMKIEDIEYLAAVHLKKGQPHVHIMWWDKNQQVLINKVDPLVCDKIRISVTQKTYRKLFSEIYEGENQKRSALRNAIGDFTRENVISPTGEYAMNIMARMQKIAAMLPERGQLRYAYIKSKTNPIVGEEIDKLTHYIIDNNPDFRKMYDGILEQRSLYNLLLHSESSDYGAYRIKTYAKQADDIIERGVGNEILRIIKAEKMAGRMTIGSVQEDSEQSYEYFEPPPYEELEPPPYEELEPPPIDDFIPPFDDIMPSAENSTPQKKYKIFWSEDFKAARQLSKDGKFDEALKLYQQEADAKNVLAAYEIGDLYRRKLLDGNPDDYFKDALNGFLELEPKTKLKGYVQYRIGRMYYDGYGTEKDFVAAFEWLKKAAENGNHYAELAVGKMLLRGEGTKEDLSAAIEYLKSAAVTIPYASAMLGQIFLFDKDARDIKLAQKYLTTAADAGNKYAQSLLDSQNAMCVSSLITSVSRLLADYVESSSSQLNECAAAFGHGDLSREQIKELLLRMQDKENTAQM